MIDAKASPLANQTNRAFAAALVHVLNKKDAIGAANRKKFIEIIDEVDGMHHLVTKPRELVSDAEALRDLSHTLVSSIKVQSLGSVTPSVFVSSLVDAYAKKKRRIGTAQHVQILWKNIGLDVSPLLKIFRGSATTSGLTPLNRKQAEPVVLFQRKPPEKKEKLMKPIELGNIAEEMTETYMIIAQMFDILKNKKKVALENLVLNRTSFAQTVENLFVLSFLVKDGRVVIVVNKKGSHYVSPRNAPSSSRIMSKEVVQSHFVFSFAFGDWK
uniref:non-structural maintenance of chromosomes element 4 homolog A-like n=1 Tax=Erigeron canadensis TaxID=72917 RepID=UPI001CB9ABF1